MRANCQKHKTEFNMGFFQKIKDGIKKTKDAFSKKLFFAFSARSLDDEFYESLEEALLTADVGVTATENLIEELKDEIFKQKAKKPEEAKEILRRLMIEDIDFDIPEYEYPRVILLSGVNGVGKTTAIGVSCEWAPTHIAGLPVAVNIQCHCVRMEKETL